MRFIGRITYTFLERSKFLRVTGCSFDAKHMRLNNFQNDYTFTKLFSTVFGNLYHCMYKGLN